MITEILLITSMFIATVSGFNMAISPGGGGDSGGGSHSSLGHGHDFSGNGDGLGHNPSHSWDNSASERYQARLKADQEAIQQEKDRRAALPDSVRKRLERTEYHKKYWGMFTTAEFVYNGDLSAVVPASDHEFRAQFKQTRQRIFDAEVEIGITLDNNERSRELLSASKMWLTDSVKNYPYNRDIALFSVEVANQILDVLTGITPGISWLKDLYELTSGRSLIDGHGLHYWERYIAAAGVLTGGIGSKLLQGIRLSDKVFGNTFLRKALEWHTFSLGEASKVSAIPTNFGLAEQGLDKASLAVRFWLESNIYHTPQLYKVGTKGKSNLLDSAFWSVQNPMITDNFAIRYGIEADNIKAADFLIEAELKPGAHFITRIAEGGTAVEVVTHPKHLKFKGYYSIPHEHTNGHMLGFNGLKPSDIGMPNAPF